MNDNDKSGLVDQTALKPLTATDHEAISEAQNLGRSSVPNEASAADLAKAIGAGGNKDNQAGTTPAINSGVLNQTVLPGEIGSAGTSEDSDIAS
jgi:hypothetical protein